MGGSLMINIPELEKMVEYTVEKILYSENADFLPLQKDKIKESL
jgi:pimeloyl-CoA synthetase